MPDLEHARPSTIRDAAWQTAYRLGFPLARICWRLRRQRHEGALVAVHVGHYYAAPRSPQHHRARRGGELDRRVDDRHGEHCHHGRGFTVGRSGSLGPRFTGLGPESVPMARDGTRIVL
jgi:hypothetical protein